MRLSTMTADEVVGAVADSSAGHPSDLRETERRDAREASSNQAYRQGYLAASARHLTDLGDPIEPRVPTTPSFIQEIGKDYPYSAIFTFGATLGAMTVAAFGLSGLVASRLVWRSLRGAGPAKGMVNDVVWSKRMDDLERRLVNQVQSGNRDRTREIDTFRREILSSLSTHATAGTVIGIEDRLADVTRQLGETKEASQKEFSKVLGQIEASNRDRRTELHGFRSEMMGQLQSQSQLQSQTSEPAPTPVSGGNGSSEALEALEATILERMDYLEENLPQTLADALHETGFLNEIEDTQQGNSVDLETFRTEVMDQLQRMEHLQKQQQQLVTPPKVDAASVSSSAPIAPYMDEARLGQVLQSAMEEVLEARAAKSEERGSTGTRRDGMDETRLGEVLRSAVEEVLADKGLTGAQGYGYGYRRTVIRYDDDGN